MMLEHFINNLKPELRYEIVKLDIKDVMEARLKVAYDLCKDNSVSKVRPSHQGWSGKLAYS